MTRIPLVNVADMNLLALLLALVCGPVLSVGAGSVILMDPELPLKKCRYLRSYDLFQAQCKDLKLNDIPTNLQSGIEVCMRCSLRAFV